MPEESTTAQVQAIAQESRTAKARYEELKPEREQYLRRARESAELTIPAIFPPEGYTSSMTLITPFQSVGADGVNSLAAKLLLALLPPGSSFFKLSLDDFVVEELMEAAGGAQQGQDARGEFEAALGKVERAVVNRLEQTGARTTLFEAIKQLVIGGNTLLHVLPDGRARTHKLSNYVVKRDPTGQVLDIVILEQVAKSALTGIARVMAELAPEKDEGKDQSDGSNPDQKTVEIYTRSRLAGNTWRVHQEINGREIPGNRGTYPKDKSAFIPLRFSRIDGEDYGRGRVEEYIGDFASLESLSQSLVEGGALAAKHVFLRRTGGTTQAAAITKARNGAVIDGDIADIGVLRIDKANDLSITASVADTIEKRLQKAFMIAQQRDAERVTAEEVRSVVQELEQTLGGIYAIMAQELQLPLVNRVMAVMQAARELPRLPKEAVKPAIITGLEALGRSSDLAKLEAFVRGLGVEFSPEVVAEYINVGAYAKRKATALQIDLEGLLVPEEIVQARRQAKAQQELAGKVGPQAIKSAASADAADAAATPAQ